MKSYRNGELVGKKMDVATATDTGNENHHVVSGDSCNQGKSWSCAWIATRCPIYRRERNLWEHSWLGPRFSTS
jgi:hypothetical protein